MKIVCQTSDLLTGVNTVLKAVPVRTTMPILYCVLIDSTTDTIYFTANDTELGIKTKVLGQVEEGGIIAINAQIFSDIIHKLPQGQVTIESDINDVVKITCEKALFEINGQNGVEFVGLPEVSKEHSITLSQFNLKELIRQTLFATANVETNKLMTGEYFEIKDGRFKIVALDGHRIAIRQTSLEGAFDEGDMIVPGKTLSEILKILPDDAEKTVSLYFTDNHIAFEFNETFVISRLIEGNYFKIDKMISNDYTTKIQINRKQFSECLDRSTLLRKSGNDKPIILSISDGNLNLKVSSPLGKMDEDIEVSKEGKNLVIGFNPDFLIDIMRAVDDEEVTMFFTTPQSPCFIRDEDARYIYLVLPIAITEGNY